jgi:ectoine hydroxylase-related dioxygenase (phytanoyl-CoA dioxygenase family)
MASTATPADAGSYADRYDRDGFIVVEQLADLATVAEIREIYDAILDRRIDCGTDDAGLGGKTRQIMFPSRHHALFRDNAAVRAARDIAAEVLRVHNPVPVFDMLIHKPPRHPHDTPWHQDMSYAGRPFATAGSKIPQRYILQFWMALDDVDAETGCMHFVPRKEGLPLLPHAVMGGLPEDSTRLLGIPETDEHLDLASAVACPLNRGGATAHGYHTPHYTPPNRSANRHRRAYIFNFADPERFPSASG